MLYAAVSFMLLHASSCCMLYAAACFIMLLHAL
jgi:hypothetical protein